MGNHTVECNDCGVDLRESYGLHRKGCSADRTVSRVDRDMDIVERLRLGGPNASEVAGQAADEIERLRLKEKDLKNVLRAALYTEPNGVDLVHRLTTFAIEHRNI